MWGVLFLKILVVNGKNRYNLYVEFIKLQCCILLLLIPYTLSQPKSITVNTNIPLYYHDIKGSNHKNRFT